MNLTGKGPLGLKGTANPLAKKKTGPYKSKRLRDFARGQECQLKSPHCNGDTSTTVLCHARRLAGAGMAQKPPDWWAYHGCAACHAAEDKMPIDALYLAVMRTQSAVFAHFGTLTP